jgi:hypothetical protein
MFYVIFGKLPKVNNQPLGEFSHNLVTLNPNSVKQVSRSEIYLLSRGDVSC